MIKNNHITEKANLNKAKGVHTFIVEKKVNKSELSKLIEKTHKVDVVKINISRAGGLRNAKKAFVTLKPGQTINEKV